MGIDPQGLDWSELALRFAAFAPGVSTAIVGTQKPENFAQNLDAISRGPLDSTLHHLVTDAFRRCGYEWSSLI